LWPILHNVETIQVVLDAELLRAINGAAKRAREIEARDRRGYQKRPDAAGDATAWERVASWPER